MIDLDLERDLESRYPGIVPPAFVNVPRYVRTLGPEVAAVATLAGFPPDPEQALALDMTFGLDERGRSAASEIACICCRQNMKTGFIKQVELGWLFVTDERLVVHSAHEFNTAREAYRDLKELIEGSSTLLRRIKPGGFKDTPADMSIETTTGARLVFKTRTKGGGRGLSGRKIVLDEAFALTAPHMGALRPLISAQPDPQLIYASSACLADSAVLHGIVTRGRRGGEPRLAFCEWCAQSAVEACADGDACRHEFGVAVGCAMDDPRQWKRANPAMGRRIEQVTIADERRAAIGELVREFGRERMGWHDDPVAGVQVIPAEKWYAAADVDGEMLGATVLAFDVQPNNLSASIVAVGRLKLAAHVVAAALEMGITDLYAGRGRWRGEITGRAEDDLDNRSGTDWLVERLAEIVGRQDVAAVGYLADGPASSFRQALLDYRRDPTDPRSSVFVEVADDEKVPRGKTRLVALKGAEYATACGALDADVRNELQRHYDQAPMNDAVEGARSKPTAEGAWKWSRKDSSVSIAPLVALTVARAVFARFGLAKPKAAAWAVSI